MEPRLKSPAGDDWNAAYTHITVRGRVLRVCRLVWVSRSSPKKGAANVLGTEPKKILEIRIITFSSRRSFFQSYM